MKYSNFLLLNDTSQLDYNPGCKATIYAIDKLLSTRYSGCKITRIRCGYAYSYFLYINKIYSTSRNLKPLYYIWLAIWKLFARRAASKLICKYSFDVCIINMEGTIHNNTIGAHVLLGLAWAINKKKIVWMINGTVQEIDGFFLKKVLSKIDYLSARESLTYEYLKRNNILTSNSIDVVFESNINALRSTRNISENACLYSPGWIASYGFARSSAIEIVSRHLSEIKQSGLQPYFLKIEECENRPHEKVMRPAAVPDCRWPRSG